MQFNVSELLRQSYGAFREYAIDDDVRLEGVVHHVTGRVRFDRVPEGIFARAAVSGEARVECSRCLEPATIPLGLSIEELYYPFIDPATGARVELPDRDEDAYRISERNMIDLALPVQQYWSMSLPIAPVCSETCRGICAECGERRDADHPCAPPAGDERWAKLREINLSS